MIVAGIAEEEAYERCGDDFEDMCYQLGTTQDRVHSSQNSTAREIYK